ncbi:hypothetical protein IJ674_00490 [bacterium]|nr:hypothetical protein [bacterium]
MLAGSVTKFRIDQMREKQGYLSSKIGTPVGSQNSYPQNNNQDIKRPLNTNHHDLSFEGLSFMPRLYKPLEKTYSKKEFLEFTRKYLGDMGEELLENVTIVHRKRTNKLISMDGDNITIHKKTIPHLAWDGILYPFKILPGDVLNGLVEMAGKIPGLKGWSEKTLKLPMFKNIRQRSKIDKKVNSLVGMITYRENKLKDAIEGYKKVHGIAPDEKALEQIKADVEKNMQSSVFQTITKPFDYKTGNYDTKHERALNRLVSGLPPAIFLANDAYNLSRMMDDDPKAAEKERKTRFKQETSRILTSGYLTLITMGAFQKFINKSKFGIVLTTGITVLVTEMFSRLSNGKHITRLTPEQARKINEKEHAPEAQIKPADNKGQISSTGNPEQKDDKIKEQQKPLLSFDTLVKASAGVLAAGYAIKGFKNIPAIKNAALKFFENMEADKLNKLGVNKEKLSLDNAVKTFEDKVIYRPFTQFYKNITSTAYHVAPAKFDATIMVLRKNGYEQLADQYEKVGKSAIKNIDGNEFLDLGSRDKMFKVFGKDVSIKPFVNFVIAPFKFMWNTVTLPYWMVDEKIGNLFRKAKPKSKPRDIDALATSFDKISKKAQAFANGKMTSEQFEDFIKINMTNAFNRDSMSNVSNAELSNLAKTAASVATIWFLMTDNYNMVMLKSNGNDKDGANTKFKERFVQEGSRLFYQTLLIDLFNSTFRNSYNASLLGMSWVTLADTTLGEILTRSSVGIPVKAHTRDELIDIETKQNNSTGFKKKYYNFMQRLTGKRSIKTYEVAPKGERLQPQTVAQQPADINFTFQRQDSLLEQMIKG